jgi:hypothetical protein
MVVVLVVTGKEVSVTVVVTVDVCVVRKVSRS